MTNNKELIRKLYEKVQEKKKLVDNAEKGKYVTDGIFRYGNNAQTIDIKIVKHPNQLKDILSFLLEKENFDGKANEKLGLSDKFTWLGATVEEWTNDLIVRKTQLTLVAEKANLNKMENDLLAMDETLLQEIRLEEMTKALGE